MLVSIEAVQSPSRELSDSWDSSLLLSCSTFSCSALSSSSSGFLWSLLNSLAARLTNSSFDDDDGSAVPRGAVAGAFGQWISREMGLSEWISVGEFTVKTWTWIRAESQNMKLLYS